MNSQVANYVWRVLTHDKSGGRLIWRLAPGDTCEIVDIDVPTERRRDGVGRKMVYDLATKLSGDNLARTIYAVTREENRIACQFYLGIGFEISGVLRRFYPDGDAVCFVGRVQG